MFASRFALPSKLCPPKGRIRGQTSVSANFVHQKGKSVDKLQCQTMFVHQKGDSVDKMTNVMIDLPIVVIYMSTDAVETGFLQVY